VFSYCWLGGVTIRTSNHQVYLGFVS